MGIPRLFGLVNKKKENMYSNKNAIFYFQLINVDHSTVSYTCTVAKFEKTFIRPLYATADAPGIK